MTATENTIRFSVHTMDKATKAKVTLENYYSNLIAQHVERKQRYVSACQKMAYVTNVLKLVVQTSKIRRIPKR